MASKTDDEWARKDRGFLNFMSQACFLLALDWFYRGGRNGIDWQQAISKFQWDGKNGWLTYFSLGAALAVLSNRAWAARDKPERVDGVLMGLGMFALGLGLGQPSWLQVFFAGMFTVCMVYRGMRSGWSQGTSEDRPEDTQKGKEATH